MQRKKSMSLFRKTLFANYKISDLFSDFVYVLQECRCKLIFLWSKLKINQGGGGGWS